MAWHGDTIGRGSTRDTMVAIVSVGDPRKLHLRPRDPERREESGGDTAAQRVASVGSHEEYVTYVVRDGVVLPHVAACTLRDVGYHGTMLVLSEPLMLQDEVRLSFDLPMSNYQARDVYARVVTLTAAEDGVLAGMEFTRTSAEFDARVQRFVQMLVAAR